jgi:hypothetical protein
LAVLDRFLGELQTLRDTVAGQSLTAPEDKTAFGFGVAVGRLEGLRLAEETLNKLLNEPEDSESVPRRTRPKT